MTTSPTIAAELRGILIRGLFTDATRMELLRLADALEAQQADMQARIDALMLEYCPDEMTPEQLAEWAAHQHAAPELEFHALGDASSSAYNSGTDEAGALRRLCAEVYQVAGAHAASEAVLDNLSAAANGDPLPHETLLPYTIASAPNLAEWQRELMRLAATLAAHWGDHVTGHVAPIPSDLAAIESHAAQMVRRVAELEKINDGLIEECDTLQSRCEAAETTTATLLDALIVAKRIGHLTYVKRPVPLGPEFAAGCDQVDAAIEAAKEQR